MKPLQLSMKAFGAFAEECRIDFTPFDKSGIYLITGETGAGKTTIFDAICYALYGTASGDVRDPKQFRSQYADPKQITCVELRFFCGNKQYLVNRTPPYLRAALRGSGMVEQKAEAELWEILPDKTAEKKEILCSGAQAVTDKVVELTGMDGKQFRQIVMIAQGEFRKFLLSSSVEKGKILRQLFHTQNCDKIQQILKERLDQQRAHVREQETQMLTLLHQASPAGEKQAELYEARLNFSDMAAAEELCGMLKTSAAELSEQAASQSEQVQEQQKAIESLLQEIEQGRQHNAVLKQLRQAEQEQQKGAVQLELCEAAAKKADADAEKVPELQEQVTLLQHSLPKYEEVAVLQAAESALQMKRKTQELACAQAKLYWEQTNASCQRLSQGIGSPRGFCGGLCQSGTCHRKGHPAAAERPAAAKADDGTAESTERTGTPEPACPAGGNMVFQRGKAGIRPDRTAVFPEHGGQSGTEAEGERAMSGVRFTGTPASGFVHGGHRYRRTIPKGKRTAAERLTANGRA